MRIGITGATGLIGRAFGTLAAAHGHELVAYTRSPDKGRFDWAKDVRGINSQAERPLDVSGLDVLVHLSGEPVLGLWTEAKKERIRSSRIELTQRIARCIAEAKQRPATLICSSAVGYYGDRADEVLAETAPRGDGFLAQVCAEWEAAAQRAAQLGLRVVQLRTGLVLAREGGPLPLMRRAFSLGGGGRLGSGKQWMPWIHVQDEARLILWAAENTEVSGALNLCGPNPVTNAEFTTTLASVMHRPAFMHVPEFVLKNLPGGLGEALLGSQRATPVKAWKLGFQFDYPHLRPALENLLAN